VSFIDTNRGYEFGYSNASFLFVGVAVSSLLFFRENNRDYTGNELRAPL